MKNPIDTRTNGMVKISSTIIHTKQRPLISLLKIYKSKSHIICMMYTLKCILRTIIEFVIQYANFILTINMRHSTKKEIMDI